jgi:hypothetical protein
VLKQHGVGERESELGADFTSLQEGRRKTIIEAYEISVLHASD